MKNIFLFAFLIFTFGCSNDDDLPTIQGVTATETAPLSISISTMDDINTSSCDGIGDSSFLMKDNSHIAGVIGDFGKLDDSVDNSIIIFFCNGNGDFFVQRFGGVFNTTDGKSISIEGFIEIDRSTHKVQGIISIVTMEYNDNGAEHYDVAGTIKESGSCNITGRKAG